MNYSDTVHITFQAPGKDPKICRTFETILFVPDVFWVNPKEPTCPHLPLCSSRRGGVHVIGLLEYKGIQGVLQDLEVSGWYIDPVKLPWIWHAEASGSLSKAFQLDQVYQGGYETRVAFRGAYTALLDRMESQAYQYLKNCTFA